MVDKAKYNADYLRSRAPALFDEIKDVDDLGHLRAKLSGFANQIRFDTFSGANREAGLPVVRVRDCVRAFQSLISRRSDAKAGFSVVQVISDVARGRVRPDLTPAFYADLSYIILGLHGRGPGLGPAERLLTVSKLKGRQAALERSQQLDELWTALDAVAQRYATGLDKEVITRRKHRRDRILKVLGGGEESWNDWHWQFKNTIRDAGTLAKIADLSPQDLEAIAKAGVRHVPMGVTPYYASLMDDRPSELDRSIRHQVIPPVDYVEGLCQLRGQEPAELDLMREEDTSPIDLITRRYPQICILKPVDTCSQTCVYCQRNWRIENAMDARGFLPQAQIDAAIDWIAEHPSIREILVTGGDPLVLSTGRLRQIFDRLAVIPSVERIRIESRALVTVPMRVDDELADLLSLYSVPGRREVCVATHVQHPYEVTPAMMSAVQRLRSRRIPVYNQLVYTFFISRRFEACTLRRLLRLIGIDPYYTFNLRGKDEIRAYRVPVARLLQEQKEEARLMPGPSCTDEAVFNVPGLGKNYWRAVQHRDLLSIMPDGSRVHEYHPWEKNITGDLDTFVGSDVPILEYLERIEAIGEDPAEYESIWYYF